MEPDGHFYRIGVLHFTGGKIVLLQAVSDMPEVVIVPVVFVVMLLKHVPGSAGLAAVRDGKAFSPQLVKTRAGEGVALWC